MGVVTSTSIQLRNLFYTLNTIVLEQLKSVCITRKLSLGTGQKKFLVAAEGKNPWLKPGIGRTGK